MTLSKMAVVTISGLLSLVIVPISGCAEKQPPFAFSRANTSLDNYRNDQADCVEVARGTKGPGYQAGTGGIGGLVVGSVAAGIQESQFRRINYNNCMAEKGYEKKIITEEESRNFKNMSEKEQDAQLTEWLNRK